MYTYDSFDFKSFIDYVLEKMNLKDIKDPEKTKFQMEILRQLDNRIITCVFNAMTDENLDEYDSLRILHPEYTNMQAILVISDKIPALREIFIKSINDLADELTYDAQRVEQAINNK